MMKSMIRYKVKPDRAEENQRFVENVYQELRRMSPPDFHYATFKLKDGVSFVHIVSRDTPENPLSQSPAFQAFQANIQDRCEEPPLAVELEEVGSYQFFSH
jgi:hypothetical protein